MGRLDGRVAMVTGASRGLGRDVCAALAREGASVAAVARTEREGESRIPGSLEKTVELVEAAGGRAIPVKCDVTKEEEVAAAVEKVVKAFGHINILINDAGVLLPGTVVEMEPRHWNLALRVNLTGVFLTCRAIIPVLQRGGGGHIINVSSRGAIGPGPGPYNLPQHGGGVTYGTTKAGVERFTQGLAAEVFQHKISANALSPHRSIWSEGGHYFRSQTGEPDYKGWRLNGEIFGDAAVTICCQEPGVYTGNILYDELVMTKEGGLSQEEVLRRYPISQ